ncbi:helix-turn-helix domain-containing protein [Saccharopolyspora taberi]|uniref:HTH cro/C1-type domain-containing protein n=1 Tax=Saccharopolyspora taberi TaxID=60895 RepID=A0ABN3VDK5_9PSEU
MNSTTFGDELCRLRKAARLTQRELAQRLYVVRTTVGRWESGEVTPDSATVAKLDAALGANGHLRRVHATAAIPAVTTPQLDAGQPASADYVAGLHASMQRLVALDGQHGGGELAPLAARLFRSANRLLAAGRYDSTVESDFTAVTAELGEVAGWLAFDALQFDQARNHWLEALHLAQLAGDTAMELFCLGNMALVAQEQRRPAEALRTCTRMTQAYRLSPRLKVMVAMRHARAAADLGNDGAVELIQRARVAADDSIAPTDPSWSWWITGSEVAAHEAGIYRARGDWSTAVDRYAAALDTVPAGYRWFRYIGNANLLDALVNVEDWGEVERVGTTVLALSEDIHSARAGRRIHNAATAAKRRAAPPSVEGLMSALTSAS